MSTNMIDEPRETDENHARQHDVRIVVDDSAFRNVLSDLESYLSRKAIELPENIAQLLSVNVTCGATERTDEFRIVLKPSDSLLELVSAARLRTGDR